MNNCKEKQKDTNKTILVLFVLFLATVWRDATIGTLSFTWVALMGGIIISLSLCAILFPIRNYGDILNDH
jgi:hypothetical protein